LDDSLRDAFFTNWFSEWAPEKPIYGWASQMLVHQIDENPDAAWNLVLGLIARAPDDDSLGWVGAGPLEDLLCHHGEMLIDRVEQLAKADPRFKQCLAGVWGSNRMEARVYERMCLAAPGKRAPGERA
jgi:hypothetical protein